MSENNALEPSASTPATPENTEQTESRPRRRRALWVALGLVPVLVAGGAVAAHAHKTVDLEIDGETQTVTTWSGSVEGLLAEQGIEVDSRDLLAPEPGAALTDGGEVVVRNARQVAVEIDGERRDVWTTALTQADIVSSLFESGRDITMSASRSLDRTALDLPLVVDDEVIVIADGERNRVHLEGEADVQDALDAADVELGRQDHVEVGSANDGTATVTVTRVVHGERTETRRVDFETVEQADDSMYEGETRVVQEGRPGERTLTYATVRVGDELVTSRRVSNEVTTDPVNRIVAYGTAERPAPEPEPAPAPSSSGSGSSSSSSSSSSESSGGGSAPSSGVWAALAQCESGGDPTTNTGNGYYGLYQFSLPTWQSVGGTGLPSEASASEQTMRAQILQQRAGWGQWPACAAELGLY
ncbi:transglycosylase family protein [Georgenia alba]|uniref:Transglycosylase family protein n=1 Tax=Georgenia alba TaxID=2233858 RepID=A0ABW2Q5S9_9MICO